MLEFRFPDIGEGITEGVILKWFVEVGQEVREGDSLFLVETDKVNAEIPSPASGTIFGSFRGSGPDHQCGGRGCADWRCFCPECTGASG